MKQLIFQRRRELGPIDFFFFFFFVSPTTFIPVNFNFVPTSFFRSISPSNPSYHPLRWGWKQRWRCRANAFTFSTEFFSAFKREAGFSSRKNTAGYNKGSKMESGARSARGIVQRGGHSINSLPLLSGLPSNPLRPPFDALERTSRVQNFSAPLPFYPRYYLIFFPRDLNSTSLSLFASILCLVIRRS